MVAVVTLGRLNFFEFVNKIEHIFVIGGSL